MASGPTGVLVSQNETTAQAIYAEPSDGRAPSSRFPCRFINTTTEVRTWIRGLRYLSAGFLVSNSMTQCSANSQHRLGGSKYWQNCLYLTVSGRVPSVQIDTRTRVQCVRPYPFEACTSALSQLDMHTPHPHACRSGESRQFLDRKGNCSISAGRSLNTTCFRISITLICGCFRPVVRMNVSHFHHTSSRQQSNAAFFLLRIS